MYASLCLGTQKSVRCPILRGVRIKLRINFRNCPLYTGRVFRLAEIKILCLSSYY